eukprot:EG_transcript_13067
MTSVLRKCEACTQAQPTHLFEAGSFRCRDCIAAGREGPARAIASPRTYTITSDVPALAPAAPAARSPSASQHLRSPVVPTTRTVSPRHLSAATTPVASGRQTPTYPVSPTGSVGTASFSEPYIHIPLRKCSTCLTPRPRSNFSDGEYICFDCNRAAGAANSVPAPAAPRIVAERSAPPAYSAPPAFSASAYSAHPAPAANSTVISANATVISANSTNSVSPAYANASPAYSASAAYSASPANASPSATTVSIPALNISSQAAVKAAAPSPVPSVVPARAVSPSSVSKSPIIAALEAEQEAIQAEIDRGLGVLRALLARKSAP